MRTNPLEGQCLLEARGSNARYVASIVAAMVLMLSACDMGQRAAADGGKAKQAEQKAQGHSDSDGIKLSKEESERAGVKVETVQPQALADSITVTATIRANQDRIARVAPRVEGRIAAVSARLGERVRAGQALAVLDSLAVGEAWSALLQARSADRVAEADFRRASTLAADEIIPQKEYLRARAEHEKAEAALRAAEDRLRLLGVSTNRTGRVESTFPIAAPLAGTIIQKKAIVGELANPSDPLFTIADLSTVWIEANLTEAMLGKVKLGANAIVSIAAFPGEHFTGRVSYVANILDKDTRTIPARIEVENKDGRLKPEMFATATIETGASAGEAIAVPDAAILLLQGQPTVFVLEHDAYEPRAIEPGEKLSGRTVVKSGIVAGDEIVTAGAYALKARLLKSQISDEH